MKRHHCLIPILLLLAFCMLLRPLTSEASSTDQKIYDNGAVLTSEEKDGLESMSRKYLSSQNLNIIIMTTDDPSLPDCEEVLTSFYDDNIYDPDNSGADSVLLGLDMANRDVILLSFGDGRDRLDENRLTLIREKITKGLTAGNYEKAFKTYMRLSVQYRKLKPGINPDNLFLQTWFQLVAALVIGGITVSAMIYKRKTPITTSGGTYLDQGNSRLLARYDRYIRTTVTKTKRPDPPSSSSSSSGGRSGGGHSYNSSRGKF